MKVSIFGLGYVGCVSLGCLAQEGHYVVGVDVAHEKVDLINKGKPTIIEKSIGAIMELQHRNGRIEATIDYRKAILNTDVSIICVGTPSLEQGHLNLEHVFSVAEQIGEALKTKHSFHVIAIRSTVLPGTNNKVCAIIERISGKKKNVDFGVVSNPEFMREGSAVDDYYHPALNIVASESRAALDVVKQLYTKIDAPIEETDIMIAELIKYVGNSFHALKIAFANEIGNICKKVGIDSWKVMEIFCKDNKLNISPAYFKPGFAYGGSCLPKDLKALRTLAHDNYLKCPIIEAIEISNRKQIGMALDLIVSKGRKNIGIIGLSFKVGTDDLRYSPAVELVERLMGKGYCVRIYDRNVNTSRLTGTNRAFLEGHIAHLSQLILDDLEKVITHADIIVICHPYEELPELLAEYKQKIVIDLVRIQDDMSLLNYEGICW
jgi:GDP-mannose 6-dehydrogenase